MTQVTKEIHALTQIKGFDTYYFDPEENEVYSLYKKGVKKLRFYVYPSGLKRVTLYKDKVPHYIFLSQITLDDSSKEVVVVPTKARVKTPKVAKAPKAKKEVKNKEEKEVSSLVAKTLEAEHDEIIEFFHERENAPMRRDSFIKKFSKEALERNLDSFIVTKNEKGTFYSLIKRLYA